MSIQFDRCTNDVVRRSITRLQLRDGAVVTLRPIRRSDGDLLAEMHRDVSPASMHARYLRFHTPTAQELDELCSLPPEQGAGFVATVDAPGETVVGLAHYIIDHDETAPPCTAEPAILVADSFQGRGLGLVLFRYLCQQAIASGITTFDALLAGGNDACIRMIRRAGYAFKSSYVYGMREIRIDLTHPVLA